MFTWIEKGWHDPPEFGGVWGGKSPLDTLHACRGTILASPDLGFGSANVPVFVGPKSLVGSRPGRCKEIHEIHEIRRMHDIPRNLEDVPEIIARGHLPYLEFCEDSFCLL